MRTFGNYELIASLATGGMSSVWLARSPGADGLVVLKRLLREHLGDPEILAMFEDEAELGQLLYHPNLVRQYEHGTAEGEPYIVLEYLQGEDVRAMRRACRKGKEEMGLDVALEVVIRVCQGLHAMHELRAPNGDPLGVVHRDVSPHNVVVTFDGNVKVIDFGIAKSVRRRVETRHGVLKGKVPYMAPEQIQAEPIDRRTDVYAAGVMLYELTVGQRPYVMPAPSDFALMMAIVRGDLHPPSAVRDDYPPSLESIVMRALSPRRAKRHATMAELISELEQFRRENGLHGGQQLLADWMRGHFAQRIEALSHARDPAELAAQIVDAEKRRRALDDDDAETAPKGGAPGKHVPRGAYALARRPLGAAVLATLTGRINETFEGAEVGRTLAESPVVVLDLSGIERVTSYGVREWLAMMDACQGTSLWLARCSAALVTQLSTIKGFAGHAKVASLLITFRCDACGTESVRPFDLELDAAELATGRLAAVPCRQCDAEARSEEDEASLLFTKEWLGKPVPAAVRGALALLSRDSADAPPPIEKVVLGTETHVRIRGSTDKRTRFRRMLDGVEGHLRIDVRESAALDDRSSVDLARALRALGPEVLSIAVQGATRALAAELQGAPRVEIVSRFAAARCPSCDAPRTVLVDGSGAAEPPPQCPRCGGPLELLPEAASGSLRPPPPGARGGQRAALGSNPDRAVLDGAPSSSLSPAAPRAASIRPPSVRAPQDSATGDSSAAIDMAPEEAAEPARAAVTDPPRRPLWPRVLMGVAGIAGVATALLLIRAGALPGAGPTASAAPTSTATAAPAPTADVLVKRDGGLDLTVIGRGATETEALDAARARAFAMTVDAVRAELPPEIQAAIEHAAKTTAPADVARRFLLHLGAGATPERGDARVVASPEGRALAVRFRVSDTLLQRAIARWGVTTAFRSTRIVPAFPTVADAGWLVVSVPPGTTLLKPGDRIVAVGNATLEASDGPASSNDSAPDLRVARGDAVEVVRWP
jgi:hypothetical protein